ncbi:hypothetical protein [Asticcacaulis sp.]|jgi:hypothetical protein|uniref:hypothetical protein n=1 Tax=Asticcacaulis sp. TaxID=1872648 RepID=UPI00391D9F9A
MAQSPSTHVAKRFSVFTGALCVLGLATAPAYAGNGFSDDAKAQFTSGIIAFTEARPMGLNAMARACGQMRSGVDTYGAQMPKWAISGQTDLCNGIDGLTAGTDKAKACKFISKSSKTFININVRSEETGYIYTYISFAAAIEMVEREHCAA